jgi:Holliday junction resolvasome RuvABC endonuclease subunit
MLAIDPSLNGTAYAYRDTQGKLVTGRIEPRRTGIARLHYVKQQIAAVVEEVRPTHVVYEGNAMQGKGRVFDIGELGGVLKLHLWQAGITILLVSPSSLKMFITGKGNADKDVMMAAAAVLAGRPFRNDDEADAFGLLLMGEAYCDRRLLPRTRGNHQQSAMKGVEVIVGKP